MRNGFKTGFPGGRKNSWLNLEEKGLPALEVSARLEEEIAQLSAEDPGDFPGRSGYHRTGGGSVGLDGLQVSGSDLLFTVGEDQVKAWTIKRNTLAKSAAGKIHSDIERGFIRAEVAAYSDLFEHGSMAKLREKGLFRLDGERFIRYKMGISSIFALTFDSTGLDTKSYCCSWRNPDLRMDRSGFFYNVFIDVSYKGVNLTDLKLIFLST